MRDVGHAGRRTCGMPDRRRLSANPFRGGRTVHPAAAEWLSGHARTPGGPRERRPERTGPERTGPERTGARENGDPRERGPERTGARPDGLDAPPDLRRGRERRREQSFSRRCRAAEIRQAGRWREFERDPPGAGLPQKESAAAGTGKTPQKTESARMEAFPSGRIFAVRFSGDADLQHAGACAGAVRRGEARGTVPKRFSASRSPAPSPAPAGRAGR